VAPLLRRNLYEWQQEAATAHAHRERMCERSAAKYAPMVSKTRVFTTWQSTILMQFSLRTRGRRVARGSMCVRALEAARGMERDK